MKDNIPNGALICERPLFPKAVIQTVEIQRFWQAANGQKQTLEYLRTTPIPHPIWPLYC